MNLASERIDMFENVLCPVHASVAKPASPAHEHSMQRSEHAEFLANPECVYLLWGLSTHVSFNSHLLLALQLFLLQ